MFINSLHYINDDKLEKPLNTRNRERCLRLASRAISGLVWPWSLASCDLDLWPPEPQSWAYLYPMDHLCWRQNQFIRFQNVFTRFGNWQMNWWTDRLRTRGEKPWWCVSLDSRHQLALWSFHYSLYVRCILSWGRALGPLGGLSTGQLNCCLPRMEEKRRGWEHFPPAAKGIKMQQMISD